MFTALLLGLAALAGTAWLVFGGIPLLLLSFTLLVSGITDWLLKIPEEDGGTAIPSDVMGGLIDDAIKSASPENKVKYRKLQDVFNVHSSKNEMLVLAQNSKNDVIRATTTATSNTDRQNEDPRDYAIAVDRYGNVLKKIKIV